MSIEIKKLPHCQVKITAQPEPEEVRNAVNQALTNLSEQIDIPGFRRGKAPPEMVRERVNDTKIALEALDVLVRNTYLRAVNEHQLWPLGEPEVDIPQQEKVYEGLTSPEDEKSVTIEYTVEVKPEIEIDKNEYKNIAVQKPSIMVQEKEVDEAVQNLFNEWKGKKEQKEKEEGEEAEIITATNLSEAEQKAAEQQQKNQETVAKLSKDAPDDEWARMIGEESLSALRVKVQGLLSDIKRGQAEQELENRIFDYLAALAPSLELPQSLVQSQLEKEETRLRDQLEQAGASLESFLEEREKTLEEVKDKWREIIERKLRIDFILDHIAREESINATEEEVQEEIDRVPDAEVRKKLKKDDQKDFIRYMIRQRKVVDWLRSRVGEKGG